MKSREWFDLNPWQFQLLWWAFERYGREYGLSKHKAVPVRAVVGGLIALLGIGILTGQAVHSPNPKLQPQAEVVK
ncbi:hypothetical protein ACE1AT_03475 [Pelatocladus sp. BLCC-F211]|uniref:hypothetical protein n=1 Tax=Pelatocladus sp. BLCC-F211 TaxID=3342752 RepID=UPI0035B6CFF1